jgi:hypothetical protein
LKPSFDLYHFADFFASETITATLKLFENMEEREKHPLFGLSLPSDHGGTGEGRPQHDGNR